MKIGNSTVKNSPDNYASVSTRIIKRKSRDRVRRCRQHRHNNHLPGRHGNKTAV